MRTTMAAIAALAAVASVNAAVPAFLKSSCASMSSNAYTDDSFAGVTDGAWSCVDFSAAAGSQQLVKLPMASRWNGWQLQVILWNSGRAAGAANSQIWSGSSTGFLKFIAPQDGQWDLNGLPEAYGNRYRNITGDTDPTSTGNAATAVSLDTVNGWSANVDGYRNAGVYAFTADVMPNPGLNTFVIENPYRDASATGSGTMTGAFMYRLVNPNAVNSLTTGGLTAESINAHFGQLRQGAPIEIPNVVMPGAGQTMTVPIGETWAQQGWAIKGLSYTVSISPAGGSGNVAQDRMGWGPSLSPLEAPIGYGNADGWERSFSSPSPGSIHKTGAAFNTPDNQKLWYDYSAGETAFGAWNGTQTYVSSSNSIVRSWNYPLDVTSTPSGLGYISFSIPAIQSAYDGTLDPYNWASQTSPFWDITITLNSVDEYPMLGSESDVELVNKNNAPLFGHNHASVATDPAMGPFKIYRVGTSNPLWWRMILNFNNVVNKNLPAGVTDEGVGCEPHWDFQIVGDSGSAHNQNGWAQTWWSVNNPPAGVGAGYDAESFWGDNIAAAASDVATAKTWLTTRNWRQGYELPSNANGALLPKISVGRGTWLLVRVSATKATVDSTIGSTKQCGSDHVTIGSMSASWDTVDDQCKDYSDCLGTPADNPNAGKQSDSANNNPRRFSSCITYQKPGTNYRYMPATACVECFSASQCGVGQYCHTDQGSQSFTWGAYSGAYTVDGDSAKMAGLCRPKSPDVLGKRCRLQSSYSTNSAGTMASSFFPTVTTAAVGVESGASISGAAPAIRQQQLAKGDAGNAEFAKGAYGACGEFRWMDSRAPSTSTNALAGQPFVNTGAGSGWVRTALWSGFCDADQICRECVPGAGNVDSGTVCLNGHAFNAMDVDNTVRTYAQNTNAGTSLGTTSMIILLIILFAAYMYTEATRWRHTNGLPPMTCCECLCCCGCCSKLDAAKATGTKNPAVAA